MVIAIYGAYMILSNPPAETPDDVAQAEKDLKAPDIVNGEAVSVEDLEFGSAADISNTPGEGADNKEFDPNGLDPSIDLDINGLDEASPESPENQNSQVESPDSGSDTTFTFPQSSTDPGNKPIPGTGVKASVTDRAKNTANLSGETGTKTPSIGTPETGPIVVVNNSTQVDLEAETLPQTPRQFPSPTERSFEKAWTSAMKQAAQRHLRESLLTLSVFFDDPNLSQANQDKLLHQLDLLAAQVIYSRQPLLEPAFIVRPGDTVASIAKQYRVPSALLQNINGISPDSSLLPGTELKVVRGPFRASISLAKNEMTLFLGHLYAGRFPISIGNSPAPRPGIYRVQLKQPGRPFDNDSQQPIPAGDTNNPYGNVWIDLGGNMGIHGSSRIARNGNLGQRCIGLSETDARDVYGILTEGSQVIIRR